MNRWHALMLVVAAALAGSCVEPRFATVTIHDDPLSLVRVEFLPHATVPGGFSHPVTLSDFTVAQVLTGVYIEKGESLFTSVRQRAFSDNEVEFLAPLLATGLSQATKEEIVVFFRIHEVFPEERTITSGGAFAIGDTLFLVVGNHRAPLSDRSNALKPYREDPLETADPEWTFDGQLDFEPPEYMVKPNRTRFDGFLDDDTKYVGVRFRALTP